MMAQGVSVALSRFALLERTCSSGTFETAGDTGRIGEDRKQPGETKIKPGREIVRNAG
jgi:hypothetical protein